MSTNTRIQPPKVRPLKIFAVDPMLGRTANNHASIDVPNENLLPGPAGSRIRVIDYDANEKVYYEPVDLNESNILIQGGLEPSEADPRFHQQMAYAVVSKVLENFELALGRRLGFKDNKVLTVVPHGFVGANAYYDPKTVSLVFGYFNASRERPGPNLPGQTVFSCLSHDIIAHETTHALVDRLKRRFIEPSNPDVAAFHEGFADIVAIFQHFSFEKILLQAVQECRSDLRSSKYLISLAQQFGYATGKGEALRIATRREQDPNLYVTEVEPHQRGSILVAAVFDAFFYTYQARIKKLVRVATGGTGILPDGDLHPDLVELIADEARKTSESVLLMCIRALDYLPPVDVTFGDYLRALVTADYELSGEDEFQQRAFMIDSFRKWGIYPQGVTSLAEESLIWPNYLHPDKTLDIPPLPVYELGDFILAEAARWSSSPFEFTARTMPNRDLKKAAPKESFAPPGIEESDSDNESDDDDKVLTRLYARTASALSNYAANNAFLIGLDPDPLRKPRLLGFHPVFRPAPRRQVLVELVVQFEQSIPQESMDGERLPRFRGGTTLVATADGTIKYVIAKPLPYNELGEQQHALAVSRMQRQSEYIRRLKNALPINYCAVDVETPMTIDFNLLHGGF